VVPVTSEFTEITVVGEDDTGLIARITSLLFERGINIEDLDQAVREGVFRMTMHVDTSGMVVRPETLREDLQEVAEELDMDIRVRFPDERDARRLAVMVTKESHCLERLLAAAESGELDAEISVVIGNHDDLHPLAEAHDVPFYDVGDATGTPDEEWVLEILEEYDVDLVALARYMRILSPDVVFRYENRIVNVHPSLLPAFPGAEAYRQAIEKGARIAGVTAHYVTTDLDQGPIITQRAFNVPEDVVAGEPDSMDEAVEKMQAIGQPLEAAALLEALQLHLDDALTVHRGRTRLRENGDHELGMPGQDPGELPAEPTDGFDPDELAVGDAGSE
jgi:formyltetrahydrofolate deformylase